LASLCVHSSCHHKAHPTCVRVPSRHTQSDPTSAATVQGSELCLARAVRFQDGMEETALHRLCRNPALDLDTLGAVAALIPPAAWRVRSGGASALCVLSCRCHILPLNNSAKASTEHVLSRSVQPARRFTASAQTHPSAARSSGSRHSPGPTMTLPPGCRRTRWA